MEIEVQNIPSSIRSQYYARLRSAKTDLQTYKKLLADSRTQLARADLFSSNTNQTGGFSSSDEPYSNDRTRLLAGTSILEQGTKRLQQSQQLAIETETQGAEILTNLRSQREQIENSRDTVGRYPSFLLLFNVMYSFNERTVLLIALPLRWNRWLDGAYRVLSTWSIFQWAIDLSNIDLCAQDVSTTCGYWSYHRCFDYPYHCNCLGEALGLRRYVAI